MTARRVVIKSRYVVRKKAGAKSVSTHLRYIERDGVTRDGEKGQAYGPETETADLKAFEERGKGDRHQFRFIVSVEDAGELEDLRQYTREFMQRMSTDLETRLDWVAVDHWDTDNPHTHIVLRGRAGEGRGKGQDLVIAPDYMAHSMRMRACELATEWLGPRTELEIRQGLLREVAQERLTSLDRAAAAGYLGCRGLDAGAQGPAASNPSSCQAAAAGGDGTSRAYRYKSLEAVAKYGKDVGRHGRARGHPAGYAQGSEGAAAGVGIGSGTGNPCHRPYSGQRPGRRTE